MSLKLSGSGAKTQGDVKSIQKSQRNTNSSIAAGAKETIFDVNLTGNLKELRWRYDGDDTTGSADTEITITIDGVVVLDGVSIAILYSFYALEIYGADGVTTGAFVFLKYDATHKAYCMQHKLSTAVSSNVKVEIENKDTTNAANLKAVIFWDEAK